MLAEQFNNAGDAVVAEENPMIKGISSASPASALQKNIDQHETEALLILLKIMLTSYDFSKTTTVVSVGLIEYRPVKTLLSFPLNAC